MNGQNYETVIANIQPADATFYAAAKTHLDRLAKPPGSLGKLEDIAARLCAISKTLHPSLAKRCVLVCAADNGIFAEGVSSAPQEITAIQAQNIALGLTGVGALAKQFGVDIIVADIGVNADLLCDKVLCRKTRKSTRNFAQEPALLKSEVLAAIEIGIALAQEAKAEGYCAVGVGEMGIGNTTTSSAVLACLLSLCTQEIAGVVGKGGGLSETAYAHKIQLIVHALTQYRPNPKDVVDVLSNVGGLDLAAMTGIYLGAASEGLPVVIDGFISIVAALCAFTMAPLAKDYMFASHCSHEPGYAKALEALGLSACLQLEMRLGEGSGCPLMFAVMDGALAVLNNMATFEAASINDDYLRPIRDIGEAAFTL